MDRSPGRLPLLGVLLVVGCLAADTLSAQSETPPAPRRGTDASTAVAALALRAGELLDKAPLGSTREGTLAPDQFLAQAREVSGSRVATVQEAVGVLEMFAQGAGSVQAMVESVPAGLPVRYHRTYQAAGANDPTVTTDGSESLDVPTYYVFEARDPYTGRIVTQTKNCLRGCTVKFVFTRPPPR
jgi:hypothetical protein